MKTLITVLAMVGLLYAWNEWTCGYCETFTGGTAGPFTFSEITDTKTARAICMEHHHPGYVYRYYTWGGWQVRIYIPGYGCIANAPTPQYIRIGGFELTIDTWLKGFHRVPLLQAGLQ